MIREQSLHTLQPGTVRRECKVFKDYRSIDEYIEDLVLCLMFSTWHYTEEQARQLVADRMDYVKEAFEEREPADSSCSEVGYVAG